MTAAIVALAVAVVAVTGLCMVLLALLVGAYGRVDAARLREAAMLVRLQSVESRAAEARVQAAAVPSGLEGEALAAELTAALAPSPAVPPVSE